MIKQIKLGDAVAKLAKAFGITHCPECEKRRLILNEIQRLGLKETAKKMRAVGEKAPDDKNETLKDVVIKLTDCCKESK